MPKLSLNLQAVTVLLVMASKSVCSANPSPGSDDLLLNVSCLYDPSEANNLNSTEIPSYLPSNPVGNAEIMEKLDNLDEKFAVKLNTLADKIDQLAANFNTFTKKTNGSERKLHTACAGQPRRPNETYILYFGGGSKPYSLLCMADPDGGLPWTIVQRRVDKSTNFFRNWTEYRQGFGHLDSNYFIGLTKLHSFTSSPDKPQELWVQLTGPEGETRNAYYDHFVVGSGFDGYPLSKLGEYSGNAGDSLAYHRGMKFSTYDRDNDVYDEQNCAITHKGAWWYAGCLNSNLNGEYGNNFPEGVIWKSFGGWDVSMEYVHMAIRPASG